MNLDNNFHWERSFCIANRPLSSMPWKQKSITKWRMYRKSDGLIERRNCKPSLGYDKWREFVVSNTSMASSCIYRDMESKHVGIEGHTQVVEYAAWACWQQHMLPASVHFWQHVCGKTILRWMILTSYPSAKPCSLDLTRLVCFNTINLNSLGSLSNGKGATASTDWLIAMPCNLITVLSAIWRNFRFGVSPNRIAHSFILGSWVSISAILFAMATSRALNPKVSFARPSIYAFFKSWTIPSRLSRMSRRCS